jgi:CID domain
MMKSSEEEDVDILANGKSRVLSSSHHDEDSAAAEAPGSRNWPKDTPFAKFDLPISSPPGITTNQEVQGASNGLKRSAPSSKHADKGSDEVKGAQLQQTGKRRGRPPGSKNKIKPGDAAAPKTGVPPILPPHKAATSVEPLTKRAKIQADLQQGLLPVAIGTAAAAAVNNKINITGGITKPLLPIRRPPQPQPLLDLPKLSAGETPISSPAMAVAVAAAATTQQPAIPSPSKNPPSAPAEPSSNKVGNRQGDLAPGEALKTWLEENKTHVVEEKLIEELPDDLPLHQPSAEELASNAACAEFQAFLPGLTSAREAISQAAAAAIKVASTGGSARAVRMVVDAASNAAGPAERLPYLYLLDSIVKLEVRQAQEQEKEEENEEKREEGVQLGFRRAVGAAMQRLVHLLLGDDQIRKKVDTLLGIWQREGFIAQSLIDPVMESLEHDAERRRKEAAAEHTHKLKTLLNEIPLTLVMKFTYKMPNGDEVVLGPPPHHAEPDDWTTPGDLGIQVPDAVPQKAVRKMKFLTSTSASLLSHSQSQSQWNGGVAVDQSQKIPPPPPLGYADREMSPWCRDVQYEAPEVRLDGTGARIYNTIMNNSHYHQQQQHQQYQLPPMPRKEQQQPPVEDIELDEFDQGLLRDAYGIGGAGACGGAEGGIEEGEIVVNPPQPPLPSHHIHAMNVNTFGDGMNPAQWGGMPMNDAAFVGAGGGGVVSGSVDMMQQQQQQWQAMQQQQQQQMMAMAGPMGMNLMMPQQQMQLQQGLGGGFGGAPVAMGVGMPLALQQQQYAMMNSSIMSGGDYGYTNIGMGMQQHQQGGGDYGGRGSGGRGGWPRGRQGGRDYHQHRDNEKHRQNSYQQHNRHDTRNATR